MNNVLKFFRNNKKEKELEIIMSLLYKKCICLSNLDEKTFIQLTKEFLKDYEILKLTMFVPSFQYLLKTKEIKVK